MVQATWWHFYQGCADSARPVLWEADEKEWPLEELSICIAAVIIWAQGCWVSTSGLLHVWDMTCLYLLATSLSPECLSIPSSTQSFLPFYLPPHKVVSRKHTATCLCCLLTCCAWSMMVSSNTARVYPRKSLDPSAHGPPDWQIGGSYPVKLFRVLCLSVSHSFWHCLCMLKHRGRVNAPCMTVSVTQMRERK